ncbi:MAG: M20/M25/M40 family metallo-hydrolase [Candidatus Hodarchaeaceae archaeon]|nr:M20/M25/M40 family metallo-hydrolase [Candidatus Hodarchaeaceae archaeon]
MRTRLLSLVAGLAFAASLFSAGLVGGQQLGNTENRAYTHVEYLVSIAPRFAGTEAEAIAASYIENEFRRYGLEAWSENFAVQNSYLIEENRLRVISPEQFELKFVPILYSPSAENVAGKLARAVELPENYEQLQKHFVLIDRGKLEPFVGGMGEELPLAILTYYDKWPAYFEPPWTIQLKVPLLWISSWDAERLIELLKQENVEVELQFKARAENLISQNVLALLRGRSDEIIVVGAHHDSVMTPGAVDGASGVAVVLEIARALSTENLPRTILFATFGSEELGLLGSAAFMREHAENKIVAAIIFGSIAAGPENGLRVGLLDSGSYATTEWLDFFIQDLARNLGFYVKSEHLSAIGGYSDHVSFTRAGVPATWIFWANPKSGKVIWPIHTLGDNLDAVDNVRLEQTASFGVQLVRWLAGQDLEALRLAYEYPLLLAAFATLGTGVVVLSIAAGSFLHYRKGWSWSQAVWVFSIVTAAMLVVIYLLVLA